MHLGEIPRGVLGVLLTYVEKKYLERHDQKRIELANYARNKRTRSLGWPREWRPGSVLSKSGLPFTEPGAWGFIAEKLLEGHEIKKIILDNPSGKEGYVMKVKTRDKDSLVYIKVHFGSRGIVGRSFHYDYK